MWCIAYTVYGTYEVLNKYLWEELLTKMPAYFPRFDDMSLFCASQYFVLLITRSLSVLNQ